MITALLTPAQMAEADRLTIEAGIPGIDLMERAGEAVANVARRLVRPDGQIIVLCGPGNNGGDGFIAARSLAGLNYGVKVLLSNAPNGLKGDARLAFDAMGLPFDVIKDPVPENLENGSLFEAADLVIDALFGAGLDRPLEGDIARLVAAVNAAKTPVLSVDLPSGLNGATGQAEGEAIKATETVTFFCLKPGHVLFPGRAHCGTVTVADIGIKRDVLDQIEPDTFINGPDLWIDHYPIPGNDTHKYTKGHAVVFSGPATSTGAARLAAMSALRAGAGLVTVASPPNGLLVNANHLTAVMLKRVDDLDTVSGLLSDPRLNACLIGPGYGVGPETQRMVLEILKSGSAVVLDADALTSFETDPDELFGAIKSRAASVVLTPHDGEFKRLFPDLVSNDKLTRCRKAAERSGAVVILKGPDTVIATPDGCAAISNNAPPWLATAGSGDVLAGVVAGLLAQGVPAFEAGCQSVWLHGEAGQGAGPGLIAEDLPKALQPVIRGLVDKSSNLKA